jgi:glycogen debranching enzyme
VRFQRGAARVPLRHRSSAPRVFEPVVAKQGSLVLLSNANGEIISNSDQGLYFHDMRYLSMQTLRLNGQPLMCLLSDAADGDRLVFELTNLDVRDDSGAVVLLREAVVVRCERTLGDGYADVVTVQNYSRASVELTLELQYAADFADMFVVRGLHPGKRGKLHEPRWADTTLSFRYDGADGQTRTTQLQFSRAPDVHHDGELTYRLHLAPRACWELQVKCALRHAGGGKLEAQPQQTGGATSDDGERARRGSLGGGTHVETSNPLFNAILTRSLLDLHMLEMRQQGQAFFAAGVPWYVALFGRDSLVTSIQTAAFDASVSANTLRVLARYQGTRVDDWRDEQPGKILHELRVDELANLNEIPQTPYYGSVDSTPLFLAVLGIHSAWTGTLDLFDELRDTVGSALDWLDRFGDSDGDGFIDYHTRSTSGARNQGWKDSGNGIVMEDGELATPPIALPEVQGDVYLAWCCMADLFERYGDSTMAANLRDRARRLYAAFNEQFWLPDASYYALCRQADGRFSRSIASNAAHALWTGIVDPEHAGAVVERVLRPQMFSGWGIRTLSADDLSYNPVDYQVGSVWPHDNAMIVAGMQRYGYSSAATQVFTAMMQAASQFRDYRLPEVFAGDDRRLASVPVKYPVACNPQAWSAGAIPFMLASVLGLRPDAFNRHLSIRLACLPNWLDWVDMRRLRVGRAEVDLHYQRWGGETVVAVTRTEGDLRVSIEP